MLYFSSVFTIIFGLLCSPAFGAEENTAKEKADAIKTTILLLTMVSNNKELFRSLAVVSSMGISAALAIGFGVWFGLFLDKKFDMHP